MKSIEKFKKSFSFPSKPWDHISQDVKDLIKLMLADPKERLTAEQVLNHKWVTELAPNSMEVILNLNVENLKSYKKTNKLKQAVLTFIASRLKDDDIKNLKEIFNSLDKNKDGTLTLDEVKEGVSKIQDSNLNIEEIFSSIDTDGSGVINYTEFLAATIDQKLYLKEERLYEAFKAFDKDGSGKISVEEIKQVMKINPEEMTKIEEMVKTFDTNGDGEIDYNEFILMMSKIEI